MNCVKTIAESRKEKIVDKQTSTAAFFESESVGERNWGEEILLGLVPGLFGVKLLKYKPGFSGNLQMHRKKHECGIVLEGELRLYHDPRSDGNLELRIIRPGDKMYYFPPGSVHKEEAGAEGCTVLEIGSTHFNDRVRMEEVYGLPVTSGLPTTSEDEIILR